jgi:hypothetical protein
MAAEAALADSERLASLAHALTDDPINFTGRQRH